MKLFESKYKRRIKAEILRLEANLLHWDNQKKATPQTLKPQEYASIWLKQKECQGKIDLLKSLIN